MPAITKKTIYNQSPTLSINFDYFCTSNVVINIEKINANWLNERDNRFDNAYKSKEGNFAAPPSLFNQNLNYEKIYVFPMANI